MKDYSQNLGYWVKRYSKLANQLMDDVLRPYKVGRTQWYILFHVYHAKTLRQRELQDRLEVESATLTRIISPLIQKGLLAQITHQKDRRNNNLVLTPAGVKLWESLPDPIDRVKAVSLRGIAAADIARARTVLKVAVHNLETKGENI